MSHFHGQRHVRSRFSFEIPPMARYWRNSAEDALERLIDVVGESEARRMTNNIEGTWREIYDRILILAELAEKQLEKQKEKNNV